MWETVELPQNSNEATLFQRRLALASAWWPRIQGPLTIWSNQKLWWFTAGSLSPRGGLSCLCGTISSSVQPTGVPSLIWEANQGPLQSLPRTGWHPGLSSLGSQPNNSSLWSFLNFLLFVQILLCSRWVYQTTQSTTIGHRTLSRIFGIEMALEFVLQQSWSWYWNGSSYMEMRVRYMSFSSLTDATTVSSQIRICVFWMIYVLFPLNKWISPPTLSRLKICH